MFDPFPFKNPPWLKDFITPYAERLDLPSLPDHIHEILFAAILYQLTLTVFSPVLSTAIFGRRYRKLSPKNRLNWDVHVVSFVQSTLVCTLAIYVTLKDKEREAMGFQERVYGYTGALGLVQAFGCGYFLWDLYVCARYVTLFGPGMLAHAVAALAVYTLGFRPFINWYATSFILYELSSPFLNIHWFCDKLDLTGSTLQLVNGICLLISFAGCRLIYGTYMSVSMWSDVYKAHQLTQSLPHKSPLAISPFALNATTSFDNPLEALEVVQYARATPHIPTLIVGAFALSNATMHILNWYWYGKMISALRKRFDPPLGTRTKDEKEGDKHIEVSRGVDATGHKLLEIDATELRKRVPLERLHTGELPPPN